MLLARASRPSKTARLTEATTPTTSKADYTLENLTLDINAVLTSRQKGVRSGVGMGNENNRKLWTADKVQSLYEGLVIAQKLFYPEFTLRELSRIVVAEGAQESTGDYRLGVRPTDLKDHKSQGFLQVTPGSVLVDYRDWGMPIKDARGKVVLDPKDAATLDLAVPRTQVVVWAWYTKNSVVAGVSLKEWANKKAWNVKTGGVTRDFGNGPLTWLAGPHNDRHFGAGKASFLDYHNRISDYYTMTGFGTQTQLDALLDRKLRNETVLLKTV